MTAKNKSEQDIQSDKFRCAIGTKEQRRLCARRQGTVGVWSAFSSVGAVGWFVALPTVLGCFLGAWMDFYWPSKIHWTLTMLGVGLFVGCALAGLWMTREKNKIIRERKEWEERSRKDYDREKG